jgi:hypothetical protein
VRDERDLGSTRSSSSLSSTDRALGSGALLMISTTGAVALRLRSGLSAAVTWRRAAAVGMREGRVEVDVRSSFSTSGSDSESFPSPSTSGGRIARGVFFCVAGF